MKKLILKPALLLLFIIAANFAKAQTGLNDTTIYGCALLKDKGLQTVGQKDPLAFFNSCPQFPGGDKAYYRFLAKHLKWPKIDEDAQGTVFISVIIEKNGKLSNTIIIHGVTQSIDKEALRVIKLSPRWIPAKLNGKDYRCRYTIPVRFDLNY